MISMNDMQQSLNRMKAAVTEWLIKEEILGDASFYTISDWKLRNEEYLNDSLLVMIFDGSTLHTILNFGGEHVEFDDLVESFGFYYELGNSWNMGFYSIENYNFSVRSSKYAIRLQDRRWISKAEQIKKRAKLCCQDCGITSRLEAHHCYYAAMREGYQPWEYPLSAFRALCRECHQSRAKTEIRMRAFMASLTQDDMEKLQKGLLSAFAFFEKEAVLKFLREIGPRDEHVKSALDILLAAVQENYK